MAAEQAIVPAKKAARTVGSNEEELNPLPKSLSIVATINPVRKTIKDLFTRMYTNKLGITIGAKPMLTNMIAGRTGKVEYDLEHAAGLSSFFLTGLAVQIPRSKLTDGLNAPWRFKMGPNFNNTKPTVGLVLETDPEKALRFDEKMRLNFVLLEQQDLDPDGRFNRTATVNSLRPSTPWSLKRHRDCAPKSFKTMMMTAKQHAETLVSASLKTKHTSKAPTSTTLL